MVDLSDSENKANFVEKNVSNTDCTFVCIPFEVCFASTCIIFESLELNQLLEPD